MKDHFRMTTFGRYVEAVVDYFLLHSLKVCWINSKNHVREWGANDYMYDWFIL
jgi:hypothetical protein